MNFVTFYTNRQKKIDLTFDFRVYQEKEYNSDNLTYKIEL